MIDYSVALFVSHLLPAPLNGDHKIRNDRCQFGSLRLLSSNRYTTIGKRLLRSVAFVANIDAKECDVIIVDNDRYLGKIVRWGPL